jgi:hypothetical protein
MTQLIIYTQDNGTVAIIRPTEEALETMTIAQIAAKDVPADKTFSIVDAASIPTERLFRNAWEQTGASVTHNIPKAKLIAHDKRREARSAEFAPLDIKATIPSEAVAAEAARAGIRTKYATMQTAIDAATTTDEIKAVMP